MLTPEARHLVKIADLDGLEEIARGAGEPLDCAGAFEEIFAALDRRWGTACGPVLTWGERYLAWAIECSERDGWPILATGWAERLSELALGAGRTDLARATAEAVLGSYAPLERERAWWQLQLHEWRSK